MSIRIKNPKVERKNIPKDSEEHAETSQNDLLEKQETNYFGNNFPFSVEYTKTLPMWNKIRKSTPIIGCNEREKMRRIFKNDKSRP